MKTDASGLFALIYFEKLKFNYLARLIEIPTAPSEIKIKTQAERIDDMRKKIFNLLDKMKNRKQELTDKFVPLSICTQLQQAIRDTEV